MNDNYAISLTASPGDFVYLIDGDFEYLADITPISEPLSDYKQYSKEQLLGDGGVRLAGWPIATWFWGAIPKAERDVLRSFCPSAYTDDIYIHTLNNENEWITARTRMFWMKDTEQWEGDKSIGLLLTFQIKSIATE